MSLTSCQFKEKILIINKSNKNDVIKLIGRPHSVSVISDDIWIYVERVLTKGELLELGRNVLIVNNSLVLKFDKYGILSEKKIYDLKDMNKIAYAKKARDIQSPALIETAGCMRVLRFVMHSPGAVEMGAIPDFPISTAMARAWRAWRCC